MPPPSLSLAQSEMSRSSHGIAALLENTKTRRLTTAHVLLARKREMPQATPNEEAERGSRRSGHRLCGAVELGDDAVTLQQAITDCHSVSRIM